MMENMLVTTCFGLSSGHHQVTTLFLRSMYNMQYVCWWWDLDHLKNQSKPSKFTVSMMCKVQGVAHGDTLHLTHHTVLTVNLLGLLWFLRWSRSHHQHTYCILYIPLKAK